MMFVLMAGFFGCARGPEKPMAPGTLVHPVYVSLIDPADALELIADCDDRLGDLPMVRSYACGVPMDIGRAEVTADYDVALVVTFEGLDAYRAYLADEDHLWVVKKWRPRTNWMRIHDVVVPDR